ncbi:MAG TPA: response regulator [Minicystis sp.]|nr:response regulator [Minicystis sp.]
MKTILVADDEYAIVEALSALLTDEGYNVVTAANGEEALARIADARPDVVLLDVMMPGIDGRGVLSRMRDDTATAAIPVIVMSAAARPLSPAQLGGAIFLRKPFDLAVLLRAIAKLVGG